MAADLRPYPEYKDSGVPWLGQVPVHWQLRRAKYLLHERDQRWHEETGTLLSVSQYRGVTKRRLRVDSDDPDTRASSLYGYKVVKPQDLVVNIMLAWNGSLGVAPYEGLISPAYCVYNFQLGNPLFFHHLLRSPVYRAEIKRRSRGVVESRLRLYTDDLFRIPLLEPPIDEQSAIVRYLDQMERRINRFIRNRRLFIEVLGEQKQAIITKFVTRGIDPNVLLRPSGIDWLGDIPEHWRLVRLKYVSRVQTGITLGKRYIGRIVEERPYLRVANVQTGRLDLRLVKTVAIPPSEIAGSELKPGDVLMTEGGDIDKLGRGCIWRGEIEGCLHQNHIFAVRADHCSLLPDYLEAFMASHHGRVYFQLTAKKTTNLASTNSSTLGAFPLILPRVSEQRRILDTIERETLALDAALNNAQSEIDLIREYHSRLIADVVIGKVDVRHLAPNALAKTVSAVVRKPVDSRRAANIFFKRAVFAAEIVHRLHDEPTFGHVKFEKLVFLCEKQCGVDTGSTYYRQAAGPYDNRALRSIDSQMEKQKWYAVQKGDKRYQYIPLAKAGGHKPFFYRYFAEIEEEFTRVIELLCKVNTERCEIIATLYSAWMDLLVTGEPTTDNRIIEQVLHHWHTSKLRIEEERWRLAIGWMKEKGLVPSLEADEYVDEVAEEFGDEVAEEVTDADD